ncbi:MAG: hypothetical protein C6I00_06285 [Nitratiruptor sp.]|nr:hypothetical protein [Nitratiruptor sp.]NPA83052.1 hypothetical protein [Campylobacterota bacterium]
MKLLLINKNPVVSRMMQMSVPKAGFDIEECESVYDLPTGQYDVVVIDDEMYDQNFLQEIKRSIDFHKLGIITSAKNSALDEFDFVLTKPFLPTDLIEILRRVKGEIEASGGQGSGGSTTPFQEESFLGAQERIVEIEESHEESPFVEQPQSKGGLLKEEEVQEVAQLLEEPQEPQPTIAPLKEEAPFGGLAEPSLQEPAPSPFESTPLQSEPSPLGQEVASSPFETPAQEPPFATQEPVLGQEGNLATQPTIAPLKEEAPFGGLAEPSLQEPAPSPFESTPLQPEPSPLAQEPPTQDPSSPPPASPSTPSSPEPIALQEDEPTPKPFTKTISADALLEDVKERELPPQEPSSTSQTEDRLQNLKQELGGLDFRGLRQILDGMQLEITIKISYPDERER